jgi:hypothetical protein
MQLIDAEQVTHLDESMLYLNISELNKITKHFKLPNLKRKNDLIENIITFVTTGTVSIQRPAQIKKPKNYVQHAELTPQTQMVQGIYKNGTKEREFLEKLIGNHFHFTVFGLEWLAEQWENDISPTYQEFADMWVREYMLYKSGMKQYHKQEWQYINFVKNFIAENPNATQKNILSEWKKHRLLHKERVLQILNIQNKINNP